MSKNEMVPTIAAWPSKQLMSGVSKQQPYAELKATKVLRRTDAAE